MKGFCAFLLALGLALPAAAQTQSPAEAAERAARALSEAQAALDAADSAQDRVAALTDVIRAFEDGLGALRDGLRRASLREDAIRARFDAESERLSRLLGVLQSIQSTPAPLLLLHPGGPVDTARSGMIVSDIAPALTREADRLRAELEEVVLLRALQLNAAKTLEDGLRGVQDARAQLAQAVSNRSDLPKRYTQDPEALRSLVDSSETLAAFASGLADVGGAAQDTPIRDFASARGTLRLPVTGRVLRGFDEADAAGVARPGLVIATQARALVTTPWAATIRYRGPLLDYGNVMILEPGSEYLMVFAGLQDVYGDVGEVLSAGAPVGMMGGEMPGADSILSDGAGTDLTETLYLELRQGKTAVDPATWFAID
ncbi:murein hydrolase activator EnvC family protein [Anianabacter salinae]|uniref:murein hydrolase activator EnvC family protein n=1 Tax=Anianabacter salinae TaxID=2851023 RepID=UPI00225DDC95|nr:peptidoglycan DD-metalloendopeptidase family protein [Anianabacter salinae]MBV0913679.1 peptidoglycan DD-metalloendopeptidase family protein [Anianabacter salinae]